MNIFYQNPLNNMDLNKLKDFVIHMKEEPATLFHGRYFHQDGIKGRTNLNTISHKLEKLADNPSADQETIRFIAIRLKTFETPSTSLIGRIRQKIGNFFDEIVHFGHRRQEIIETLAPKEDEFFDTEDFDAEELTLQEKEFVNQEMPIQKSEESADDLANEAFNAKDLQAFFKSLDSKQFALMKKGVQKAEVYHQAEAWQKNALLENIRKFESS